MEMETAENLEEPEHGWRLVEVRFDGLLGNEKQLVLNLDPDGTILTGQNGSGKSTILRAIDCAQAEETWREFAELPLDAMALKFEDGFEVRFERGAKGVVLKGGVSGTETWEASTAPRDFEFNPESQLAAYFAAVTRHQRPPAKWMFSPDGDKTERLPWLSQLVERLNVKLVRAGRLERLESVDLSADLEASPGSSLSTPKSAVDLIPTNLRERIKTASASYTRTTPQLFKDLRNSVIEELRPTQGPATDPDTAAKEPNLEQSVQKLRDEVVSKSKSLAELGILEAAHTSINEDVYDPGKDGDDALVVLKAIYEAELSALEKLEDLRLRVTQFRQFANERFSGKEVVIDREEGFKVVLPSGEDIRPSGLSSGEQHLLVLAYDLLFVTPSGSLVLIDEPELSLHVAWLRNLFTAFLDISDQRDLQFIIATHSPTILSGYGDRIQSIDELLT